MDLVSIWLHFAILSIPCFLARHLQILFSSIWRIKEHFGTYIHIHTHSHTLIQFMMLPNVSQTKTICWLTFFGPPLPPPFLICMPNAKYGVFLRFPLASPFAMELLFFQLACLLWVITRCSPALIKVKSTPFQKPERYWEMDLFNIVSLNYL